MIDTYASIREFFIEDRGWSNEAVSGNITTEQVVDMAQEFLRENEIPCESACIFGSTATNTRKPFSDIDIFIIDASYVNFTKERTLYRGMPIELNMASHDTIIKLMNLSTKNGSPYFLYPMVNNILIHGDSEVFDNLRDIAVYIIDSKPAKLNEIAVSTHREMITSQIIDIVGSTNKYDSYMLSCACINSMNSLYLQDSTGLVFTGRYSLTMMRELHPDIAREFERLLQKCFTENNFSELVHFLLILLDKFGGISWKKSLKIVQKL